MKTPRSARVLTFAMILACTAVPSLAASVRSAHASVSPIDISAPGQHAASPKIVSSTDGSKLTAIWYRSNGANNIVQAATSTTNGSTWSSPIDISPAGQSAHEPQIASSADGSKLTAIWYRSNGANLIVQAATSTTSGTAWSTATDLSLPGRNAINPQITSSADGSKLTAIWIRSNGNQYIVQAATSTTSGTAWSTATDLSLAGGDASEPQIVGSTDGTKLTALWTLQNGNAYVVQAASSTTSGTTWSPPVTLSGTAQATSSPRIVSSTDGAKLTAVWSRWNGSHHIIQSVSSTTSGATWSSPINISPAGQNAGSPQLASSSDGTKLTAVWSRLNVSEYIVQTASSADGGSSWGPTASLATSTHGWLQPRAVSSVDGTKLTAIWSRYDGSDLIVQAASSSNSGVTWSNVTNLSQAGGDADSAQIAGSADGSTVTAVWWRDNGSHQIVQVKSGINIPEAASSVSPNIVPVWRATLDPNGGTCTDGTTRSEPWTSVSLGYRYLPGASDCTRPGYTFTGWANTEAPTIPLDLPLLNDPSDGAPRYFIATNTNLIAIWTKNPEPKAPTTFVALNGFFCRNCGNWLIWNKADNATAVNVTSGNRTVCTTLKITIDQWTLCHDPQAPRGPNTYILTATNGTTSSPPITATSPR